MNNNVDPISTSDSKFTRTHFSDFDLLVISDGEVQYDNSCFAPGVSRISLQQARAKHNILSPHFKLTHNILLIISKNSVVMIDAGNGDKAGPGAGKLVANLKIAGIEPYELTDIVLTHAHPDHIYGLIGNNDQLIFPNAKIHIHQKEFDFWQDDDADFSKSKSPASSLKELQQEIKSMLTILRDKLYLFNDTLFDFLQPIHAPGHTPGHCMFAVTLGKEAFIHMADIFHDEIVLFARPDWGTVFDVNFDLAANARQAVLEEYAQSGQKVFGYHLPWPGFGYINKVDKVYEWVQEQLYNPKD